MNKWEGIGNLVRDPELSFAQGSQTAKCLFTMACNRSKRNGEDQGADYIRIVTWGKRAEVCDRYLRRGSKVGVSGMIRTGSYKDKDGKTVYTTDVWADEVEFLSSSARSPYEGAQNAAPPSQQVTAQNTLPDDLLNDMPDTFQAAEDEIPF